VALCTRLFMAFYFGGMEGIILMYKLVNGGSARVAKGKEGRGRKKGACGSGDSCTFHPCKNVW